MSEAIIAAAEAIHAARPDGDPGCAFMERLRAAPETGNDLLAAIITWPEYSAIRDAVAAFSFAADHFTGQDLADWQAFWFAQISNLPFEQIGRTIQAVIRAQGETIAPAVWPAIISWFADGHLHPKAFFAQPAILAKIPDSDALSGQLSALPANGRRDLAPPYPGATLRGGRAV